MPSMRRARGAGAGRGGAGGRRGRRRDGIFGIVGGGMRDGHVMVHDVGPDGRQGFDVAMAGLELEAIAGAIMGGMGEVDAGVGGEVGAGVGGGVDAGMGGEVDAGIGGGEDAGMGGEVDAGIGGGLDVGIGGGVGVGIGGGVGVAIGGGVGAGIGGGFGAEIGGGEEMGEGLGLERYGVLRWDEIRRLMGGGPGRGYDPDEVLVNMGAAIARELQGQADRAMGDGEARAMGNEEEGRAINEGGDGAVGAAADVGQGEAAGGRERALGGGNAGGDDREVEIMEYGRFGQAEGGSAERSTLTPPLSLSSWKIQQDVFTMSWNLQYLLMNTSNRETLWSPTYTGGAKANTSWRFKTHPRMFYESGNMVIDFFHVNFGDGDMSLNRKVRIRYHFVVVNANGQAVKENGSFGMVPIECKRGSGFRGVVVYRTELLNPHLRLLEDGNIKIRCTIWTEWDVVIADSEKREMEEEMDKKNAAKLSLDLGTMLKDEVMSDVSITTPTRVFQAHKNILSARSNVFAAMFRNDMTEKNLNLVDIIDFDEHLVAGMLEYIYTGRTNVMDDFASGLLQISDKYDIGLLKEACEHKIAANLTVENAACVLEMAHLYNAAMLKPRVMDYINRNMDAVRRTAKFQQMTKELPSVIAELYMSL